MALDKCLAKGNKLSTEKHVDELVKAGLCFWLHVRSFIRQDEIQCLIRSTFRRLFARDTDHTECIGLFTRFCIQGYKDWENFCMKAIGDDIYKYKMRSVADSGTVTFAPLFELQERK